MIQPLITIVLMELNGEPVTANLVRVNGVPVAVLKWGGNPDAPFAQEKIELDEAHLEQVAINGPLHWRYHLPVSYPAADSEPPPSEKG